MDREEVLSFKETGFWKKMRTRLEEVRDELRARHTDGAAALSYESAYKTAVNYVENVSEINALNQIIELETLLCGNLLTEEKEEKDD